MLETAKIKPQLLLASENQQRIKAFQHLGAEVTSISGGDEDKNLNPEQIMRGKLKHAYQRMVLEFGQMIGDYIAAVDVMNKIFIPEYGSGRIETPIKAKPENEDEIMKNFIDMTILAELLGYGHYQVVTASGLVAPNSYVKDVAKIDVKMTPQGLKYLSTEQGFTEYLQVAKDLSTEDFKVEPLFITAGISTETLMAMGIIKEINSVQQQKDEISKMAFMRAFAHITTGIGDKVARQIHPEPDRKFQELSWVAGITKQIF